MKKILVAFLLGTFLIGCKVKQSVSLSKREVSSKKESTKTVTHINKDDGLFPLPEDTGKFIRFEVASIDEYINTFSEIAQMEMKAFGIPASITLAQGLLESGLGKGELAMKTNNHFGIKCHTGWEGDFDYHDDDEKGECFRKYNHPMYSFRDHSKFLASRSRYAFLFDLRSDDYKAWAKGLSKAGYATDKRYPHKLVSLIETHHLHKFDSKDASSKANRISTSPDIALNTPSVSENKTYVVKQGDTLYSISRSYSVSLDDLKRWNYLYDSNISVGQKLVVKTAKFN
ncbi:MAG: glucosaminidase domain-containing protein [Flavobacteriaceae bacterium]